MKSAAFALGTILMLVSYASHAQMSGEGDVAYSQVSGNTESNSLALGLELVYEIGKWEHRGKINAHSASQNEEQSAESYSLNLNSHYEFSERTYAFGDARYLNDRFSSYDYQATIAFGVGRAFIDNGTTFLKAESGLGYRISDPEGAENEDAVAIVLMSATLDHQISETTKFESDYRVETGEDNTFIQAELGLKVAILDALALRLAYLVKHNTEVPAGTEKTDTLTTIGLNYSF